MKKIIGLKVRQGVKNTRKNERINITNYKTTLNNLCIYGLNLYILLLLIVRNFTYERIHVRLLYV